MAKELFKRDDKDIFLKELPHKYFEENQLHAFIISLTKDMRLCIERVNAFLPYVDNWATCDQLCPNVFVKNHITLMENIDIWLASKHTYTLRFGIKMLMSHFLDEDFKDIYPKKVAEIQSDQYYVNMMIAWYFATALAKKYEAVLPFIEKVVLSPFVHNKAIQKAVESYRVSSEHKEYLKTLKRGCEISSPQKLIF